MMTPTPKNRITPDQFISLEHVQDLPYLKHVELIKYSPKHFGLEKWTRLFVIPDSWMRKIYRNQVYKDTDAPQEEEDPPMTKEQRDLLYDWLVNHSPIKYDPPLRTEARRSQGRQMSFDDLLTILGVPNDDMSDTECDSKETIHIDDTNQNYSTIPTCYGHRIQPECVIFEKAISKMSKLSAEDEDRLKGLMNDADYMKMLDNCIKEFLGKDNNNLRAGRETSERPLQHQ